MARWPGARGRLVALALGFLIMAGGAGLGFAARPPSVWIDAPLDGTTLDQADGAIHIVGHVTEPNGVDRARLDADGARVARTLLTPEPGELVTVEFGWQPTPGRHVLSLWTRNAAGEWVGPAIATVTVEGENPEPPPVAPTTSSPPTTSKRTAKTLGEIPTP